MFTIKPACGRGEFTTGRSFNPNTRQNEIEIARAEERERCAKIAEKMRAEYRWSEIATPEDAAQDIADHIRQSSRKIAAALDGTDPETGFVP